MKKITILLASLLFLCTTQLQAQQEANIFIPRLSTDKLEYVKGETIKSEFQIDNNSSLRQSDIYITSSLIQEINGQNIELDTQTQYQNMYLEAMSKRTIQFDHTIQKDINGTVEFVVYAHLGDGSLVGQKSSLITISNQNIKPIISFENFLLDVSGQEFSAQVGPTISDEDTVSIKFITGNLPKENIEVSPKIDLYNRTHINNEILKTFNSPKITLQSNTEYRIDLPTDLDPLVYEGVLSFVNFDYIIPNSYFRYIKEGPIGTIINVNTSKLSVQKGETIQVYVEFAGTPPDITRLTESSSDIFDEDGAFVIEEDIDLDSLSDEELIQLLQNANSQAEQTSQKAFIEVVILDEKQNVIGTNKIEIDLNKSGKIPLDVEMQESSEKINVVTNLTLEDGTVLSTYKIDLPSEKELQKTSGTSQMTWITALFFGIVIFILILAIFFIRKKLNHYALVLIIPLLASVWSFSTIIKSDAFTVEFTSFNPDKNPEYFKVNTIFSPGPADSVSYAPGEAFKLSLNASYIACANAPYLHLLYGPSNDWWNFTIGDLQRAFDYQMTVKNSNRNVVRHINVASYVSGDWGNDTVLPRFTDWWTSNGTLSYVPYKTTVPAERGFYQTNVSGKKGFELFRYKQDNYVQSNHRLSSDQYTISPDKTYYMPTEPGFHTFYFMLLNYAGFGNISSTRIVSQEVCVRGAGVCPGETIEPPICPNLIGTFTKNTQGQIFQNGTLTNYTQDAQGNCIIPPPTCNNDYTEGELICINNLEYTMSCSTNATWQQNPTGKACTQTPPTSAFYCEASPTSANLNQNVTFTAYPLSATSYVWKRNGETVSTDKTFSRSFTSTGRYTYTVDITTPSGTQTKSCSVSVGTPPPPPNEDDNPGDTDRTTNITSFKFNPSIANEQGQCPLELSAENVTSCTLRNRMNTIIPFTALDTRISITNQPTDIGAWTLTCTGVDETITSPITRSCISNPAYEQF